MNTTKRRILIIGLDGFTWQVGNKLVQNNYMPTLSKLMDEGCSGNLESVIPFETSAAWSSFQTGCLPGKTGVFTFHSFHRGYNKILLNSFDSISVPSIWQLASQENKKVVSINMPITSPPPEVNGIIIPGLMCPKVSSGSVYPPDAYDRYIRKFPKYQIVDKSRQSSLKDYVDRAIDTEQTRCDMSLKIMNDVEWDIFSVEMQSTDFFQHRNWWALDHSARGYTEQAFKTAAVLYKKIDTMIRQLIEGAGKDVLVFIVSDHGFCKKQAEIRINSWLLQNGYLSLNPSTSEEATLKDRLKKNFPFIKRTAQLYGNILKLTSPKNSLSTQLNAETVMKHAREIVDMEKTSAFCLGGMAGLLYIKNKRKDLGEKIVNELMSTFGTDSTEPLISSIESAEKLYRINHKNDLLPDYVVSLLPGVVNHIEPNGPVVTSGDIEGRQTGTHAINGIYIISGPEIKRGLQIDASIVDIAPTILSRMDISLPDYMDGRPLEEAFTKSLETKYIHKDMEDSLKRKKSYSEEQQSEVEKQLRDLGYL